MASEEVLIDELSGEVEPGEVPSTEHVSDSEVNVLEDILKNDEDELQKELDSNANGPSKKKTPGKLKTTPKRKPGRKSKTPAKPKTSSKTKEAPVNSTKQDAQKTITSQVEVTPVANVEPVTVKVENIEPIDKAPLPENKPVNKTSKKEKVSETVNKEHTNKADETPKTTNKTSTSSSKTSTKKIKKSSTKKEIKKEVVEPVEDEKVKKELPVVDDEKASLEKKVKELEKTIAKTNENSQENQHKKETKKTSSSSKLTSSDRKRKASESTKDSKTKKSSKTKVKTEEVKQESPTKEAEVKQEDVSENEDMKVVDDVDTSQVEDDIESNFSHASSFSHTFSRSRSLSGSFTATFSDSLSLSSFTGSNGSLEFSDQEIDEETGEAKPKKRRKHTGDEEDVDADLVQNHKDFIDSLLKGARYFIVKSNNHENVTLSKAKGVWSTPPANERKLNDAYKHSTNVILIFSVKESGRFQGFARLASESRRDGVPIAWVVPPGFDPRILGGTFKVDWLNRKEVPFAQCTNLRNPWNENKEVKICRDGQEVEPSVGEVLCRMFEDDLTVDLSRIARHLKQRKKLSDHYRKSRDHHSSRYHRGGFSRGSFRGDWRGGRGDFRGGFRGGYRGRYNSRRGSGYFHRGSDYRGRGRGRGSFHDNRYRDHRDDRHNSRHRHSDDRSRSRSPPGRRHSDSRDSRERRHKDKVKEFLKNDRAKFGVRKETLLHGSYSDYVREFQRQKQYRPSSSYQTSYPHTSEYTSSGSSRHTYDPTKAAAEEFLRRASRR